MEKYTSLYQRINTAAKAGALTGLALILSGCVTMTGENGVFTVATSPVRPSQWKTHPYRTGAVTAFYAGGIAAAFSGGGGGSSETAPAPGTPSRPRINGSGDSGGGTPPSDGGGSDGGGQGGGDL